MRFICDGHEYRVIETGNDVFIIRNNYGTEVASLERDEAEEYWIVTAFSNAVWNGGETIARWHENDVIDNLLEQNAVQAYVAWATDNETVEEH